MRNIRLIARLDVKAPNLVKGVQFEGLRKLGDPNEFAERYYLEGIDEIYYEDIVASLYERNNILEIVAQTTRNIFVPVTVGGGLRTGEDVAAVLRAGADKVAINTGAIKSPEIITEISRRFGSQCMVLSIQAKKNHDDWEAFYDNGREHSGLDVIEWARRGQNLGAGEIILTSVDQEGTGTGLDIDLVRAVTDVVDIPVVASGGLGNPDHLVDVINYGNADAVAIATALHYQQFSLREFREKCLKEHISVRVPPN